MDDTGLRLRDVWKKLRAPSPISRIRSRSPSPSPSPSLSRPDLDSGTTLIDFTEESASTFTRASSAQSTRSFNLSAPPPVQAATVHPVPLTVQTSSHLGSDNNGDGLKGEEMRPSPYNFAIVSPRESSASSTAWGGLMIVLRTVKEASEVFPPLKAALGSVIEIIDTVQQAFDNEEHFNQLARRIAGLEQVMLRYRTRSLSPDVQDRLRALSQSIEEQTTRIRRKLKAGLTRRILDGSNDAQDIATALYNIASLIETFQLETSLSIELNTEEIRMSQISAAHNQLLEKLPRVVGASHKSGNRAGCMEGTRTAVLDTLLTWATHDTKNYVYWLNGMAGTGKTAISQTFSQMLETKGLLAASFFCSRGSPERGDVNMIIPTLAHDLALSLPSYRNALLEVLVNEPDAGSYSLHSQISKLLLEPLRRLQLSQSFLKQVIVIDALDECPDGDAVCEILNVLLGCSDTLPVKFFISSRPEQHIRESFDDFDSGQTAFLRLHDVEDIVIQTDIRTYLIASFHGLSKRRKLVDWPSDDELNTLVEQCDRLFIYASTAVQYVSERIASPRRRLSSLLQSPGVPHKGRRGIDHLYSTILQSVFERLEEDEKYQALQALNAVVCIRDSLPLRALSAFLDFDVRSALDPFHSVLRVPHSSRKPVELLHASFSEYLRDEARCLPDFYLSPPVYHSFLTLRSLACMNLCLSENICDVERTVANVDIPKEVLSTFASRELQYSCMQWTHHLILSDGHAHEDIVPVVQTFFDLHLLHWLEMLSLLKSLHFAVPRLSRVREYLQAHGKLATDSRLLLMIDEAFPFVQQSFDFLSLFALELYHSALVWLPQGSAIRCHYAEQRAGLPRVVHGLESLESFKSSTTGRFKKWSPESLVESNTLDGHAMQGVTSIASFEGKDDDTYFVSASVDGMIRVWKSSSYGGGVVRAFKPDSRDAISAVSSSYDGTSIAWASRNTIWLWTCSPEGQSMRPLVYENSAVSALACSADGTLILSGSWDGDIRVWEAASRVKVSTLSGHLLEVNSLACSQSRSKVISGSSDKTIRIWYLNRSIAQTVKVLSGHSDIVTSVACSQEENIIISGSGSEDKTVRVWNADSGQMLRTMQGHEGSVTSVACSQDCSIIVSGSSDNTVRVWNLSGETLKVLKDHSANISSVVCSPDGDVVASGSLDQTVRVWTSLSKVAYDHNDHEDLKCMIFLHDALRYATVDVNRVAKIRRTSSGKLEEVVAPGEEKFMADGSRMEVFCDEDNPDIGDTFELSPPSDISFIPVPASRFLHIHDSAGLRSAAIVCRDYEGTKLHNLCWIPRQYRDVNRDVMDQHGPLLGFGHWYTGMVTIVDFSAVEIVSMHSSRRNILKVSDTGEGWKGRQLPMSGRWSVHILKAT